VRQAAAAEMARGAEHKRKIEAEAKKAAKEVHTTTLHSTLNSTSVVL
jgi:hypothetical protein